MWCARLSLSRPDSAVVVRAGRNWAAFGSPFFLLGRLVCTISVSDTEVLQDLSK